jgi:hypothetical protein
MVVALQESLITLANGVVPENQEGQTVGKRP